MADSVPQTHATADYETLTSDDLLKAWDALRALGPILGAVLVLDDWCGELCLEVTVSDLSDLARQTLHALIGDEGLRILGQHKGQKVVIISARDFDAAVTKGFKADASLGIFGLPVYRIGLTAGHIEDTNGND